ncbi:MAG: ECF transporter S component [Calditrichaeota bacterium]|nr:ECF transporter S component [Calditrichota bacterium]
MTWGALFITLGILLPILFHLFGLGPVFLPMFIPILTAGFLMPPASAIFIGVSTPILSFLITHMPPVIILPLMIIEGLFLGGIPAVFYGKLKWNFWLVLLAALIFDRILLGMMVLLLAPVFHLPSRLSSIYMVVQGFPGILLNLFVVSVFVKLLKFTDAGRL